MYDINFLPGIAEDIGKVGENEFREIKINVDAWLDIYPDGTIIGVYNRPDGAIYTITSTVSGGVFTWSPSSTDLAVAGNGQLEIRITDNGVIGKSTILQTVVEASLGDAGGTPEAPSPDWLTEALETISSDKAAAAQSAADAEGYATTASADAATATTKAAEASDSADAAALSASNASDSADAAAISASSASDSALSASASKDAAQNIYDDISSGEAARIAAEAARVSAEETRATFYDGFNTAINQLDAQASFGLTNIVSNGNFANGTTGFTASSATIAAANNILSITGNGSGAAPYAAYNYVFSDGHKIYAKAKMKVTNANCSMLYLRYYGTSGINFTTVPTPESGTVYVMSGIVTTNAAASSPISMRHDYSDAATANGKVMEVQEVMAIDLTAHFGAGNEPATAEMEALLQVIPDNWFDGTLSVTQEQIVVWTLNLIRANTAAIAAL